MAIAECLAKDRPDWELAAGRLGHAVAHHPGAFAPKVEFAMDWYYPMLSGALEGEAGRRRIAEGWSTFVMEGLGVRCVSTGDWVTAAETAECVLTLDALGMDGPALDLFAAGQNLRLPDGSYWTGMVYPERGDLPQARAHHLHLRRHGAGRRRAVEHDAGGRAVPRRVPARPARPGRAALRRRHGGVHGRRPERRSPRLVVALAPRAPPSSRVAGRRRARCGPLRRPGGAIRRSTRRLPQAPSSTNSPDSSAAQ